MDNNEFISADDFMNFIFGDNNVKTDNAIGEAAKAMYDMYFGFVTAGFSESQAMELLIRIVVMLIKNKE